ncbi:hypothetical protein DUNSADRAFT_13350 [Dunaliella salina]|uniref:tRNA wybutosine-synthesis domain-containing protein n=1 Tax=Dunaliella salina TaxID=3046 RepID=A0ABQ7G9J5_DUNSA|nr:hypothetical protein DUNSADRAFT_13350 [Dunaliella salina]|eukprot:KAF5831266.1 hypothetical protein DUNSADRAFT_13350 [Dunaliella salina]
MAACDHEALLSPPTSSSNSVNNAHGSSNKREVGSSSSSGGQHQHQQQLQQGEGGGLAPGTAVLVVLGNFNACALRLDAALSALGAPRLGRVALGDEDNGSMDTAFKAWTSARITKLLKSLHGEEGRPKGQQQQQQQGAASSSQGDEEGDDAEAEDEEEEMSEGGGEDAGSGGEVDMEDLAGSTGPAASNSSLPQSHGSGAGQRNQNRRKSRPPGAAAAPAGLGNQQQPTGGCYKHSFYGIASHRCMEATPSLACANKCVFCWRHHTNPVGRSWRWAMDPADEIVGRAVLLHRGMVREYAGAPGVSAERVAEGMDIRHCALSLLRPVTQLYVSVDAATPETLKAVDRPLFADYWERFTECLRLLKDKRQRTVYRLTLVKNKNMNDVAAYAQLLDLGRPDFIEIKGVTYCGDSPASDLTMEKNVPWHHEVVEFSQALCDARNGEYALACEHAHSCCVVLARPDRFLRDGHWHTWIDYHKFHELATSGKPFTSEDYMLPTPSWAVFGAAEAGFDPAEMRWKRTKGKGKAHQPSDHNTNGADDLVTTNANITPTTGNDSNSISNGNPLHAAGPGAAAAAALAVRAAAAAAIEERAARAKAARLAATASQAAHASSPRQQAMPAPTVDPVSSRKITRTSCMMEPHELHVHERRVHLVEIKFCGDTRPERQLNMAKQRHAGLCKLINAKAVTIHPILLGVVGTTYTEHNLKQFKL